MEKKNNNLIIIILFVIILGLGGFIVYDKLLKDNGSNDSNNKVNETENGNLSKLFAEGGNFQYFDEDGLKIKIEKSYLQDLPLHYDKNGMRVKSYKMTDLSDKELSEAVWYYISRLDYYSEWPKSVPSSFVDSLLKIYNLQNRVIKELKTSDTNAKVLKKDGSNYVADVGEDTFALIDKASEYRVERVTYNEKTNEIDVYFFQYYNDHTGANRDGNGVATYKIIAPFSDDINKPYLSLDRVKFD